MHTDTLIRMANQIGTFFEAMPDRAEAMDGVAQHIRKFWEPRMRRRFLAQVDSGEGGELIPLVAEVVRTRRDALE